MKWSFQLEIDNQPTVELVAGREYFFDGQLNLITRAEALDSRANLLVTTSDPLISKKPSLAIRSIGKYPLTYKNETHRKFFFHLFLARIGHVMMVDFLIKEPWILKGNKMSLTFFSLSITTLPTDFIIKEESKALMALNFMVTTSFHAKPI